MRFASKKSATALTGARLQLRQRGPLLKQSSNHHGVDCGEPIEHLRKVHLELSGQPVEITRLVVDCLAPRFNQKLQRSGLRRIRLESAQALRMLT